MCVLRFGINTFHLIKFFTLTPPLPLLEVLMFLFRQQTEFTFEIQHVHKQTKYHIGLIVHDHGRYDDLYQELMDQANNFRMHLRRQQAQFSDVGDYLNAQLTFYAPYFCGLLAPLKKFGKLRKLWKPARFPELTREEDEIEIREKLTERLPQLIHEMQDIGFREELTERTFTLHLLAPDFEKNKLYDFLDTLNEDYYLQFHLRPICEGEFADIEHTAFQHYRNAAEALQNQVGPSGSTAHTAFTLLTQVKDSSPETVRYFLAPDALRRLSDAKQAMHNLDLGRRIGTWEVEITFLGNAVLASTLAVKIGGNCPQLPAECLTRLAERRLSRIARRDNNWREWGVPHQQFLHSRLLHSLLPQTRHVQVGFATQRDQERLSNIEL